MKLLLRYFLWSLLSSLLFFTTAYAQTTTANIATHTLTYSRNGDFTLTVTAHQERAGVSYELTVQQDGKTLGQSTTPTLTNCQVSQVRTQLRTLNSATRAIGWLFSAGPTTNCQQQIAPGDEIAQYQIIISLDPDKRGVKFAEFTAVRTKTEITDNGIFVDSYMLPTPNPESVVIPSRHLVTHEGTITHITQPNLPSEILLKDYRPLDSCLFQRSIAFQCKQNRGDCTKENNALAECKAYEFSTLESKANLTSGFFQCLAKHSAAHASIRCVPDEMKFQENILQEIYKAALADADAKNKPALTEVQDAWQAYRDKRCDYYLKLGDNPDNQQRRLTCRLESTLNRRLELEHFVPTQEEE